MVEYLLDSNVIIDYLSGKLPENGTLFLNGIINQSINISIISKIEVLGFPLSDNLIEKFVEDSNVFSLTDDIAEKTISLRKIHKVKIPDAIIAATAIEFGFTLITRNTTDFKQIHGLKTIDAHALPAIEIV